MNDLIERLRSEAEISDRPGQFDRLNAIADEFAAEIEALRAEVEEWKDVARCASEQQDSLFREARALSERADKLRSERDALREALKDMRQVLEVLGRAHHVAMEQTLKARIPECGEFAGIAQDLDFVVAALRERLGEGAEP